jgi:Na+/H+ antiporter NhaD/arsenite permease-like protein
MDFTTTAILIIFILSYLGIALGGFWGLKLDRTGIVLLGAIAMLAFGGVSLQEAVNSINVQSILLLFALMVIASQLQYSGFYHQVALFISDFLEKPKIFLAVLMFISGGLSAFLNNDVVCFAFAPVVAVSLLKKRKNPIPYLVALAISSNVGCALTLIGNAQGVLIGQIAKLNFGHYMLWAYVPVLCSMILAYFIILTIMQKSSKKTDFNLSTDRYICEENVEFHKWRTIKGVFSIVIMILLFFTPFPRYLVALVVAGFLLCSHNLNSKDVLKLVDWQLLILFIGLFVIVGAFRNIGLSDKLLSWLTHRNVDLDNPYQLAIVTALMSNIINNSAAVMLFVHIVDFSNYLNAYVLAMANTLSGNLLILGSLANIIVVKKAQEYGVDISFLEFAKYGIPIAVGSLTILLLWIFLSQFIFVF